MALQKTVELIDIKDSGDQFSGKMLQGTVILKCWAEGADIEADDPVFTKEASAEYKIVDGQTVDDQIAVWTDKLKKKLQGPLNAYIREEQVKNNAKVVTALNTLATEIGG